MKGKQIRKITAAICSALIIFGILFANCVFAEPETDGTEQINEEAEETSEAETEEENTELPSDEEQTEEIHEEETESDEAEQEIEDAVEMPFLAATGGGIAHVEGSKVYYGNYTHYYTANGNTAFCLEPQKDTLPTGNYSISRYLVRGQDDTLIKAAWYLYGGPGWNGIKVALFGEETANQIISYGYSHAIASLIYQGDSALSGISNTTVVNQLKQYPPFIATLSMPPAGFDVFLYTGGSGKQMLMGWSYTPVSKGKAYILKVSSNTDMTSGNSCYSLEGAVYEIYKASNNAKVGTLTTDATGKSNTIELNADNYYAKEITAPKGYGLKTREIYFTVKNNSTTVVNTDDSPQNDPAYVFLKKLDKDTGESIALGDGSLANAEYTVKYYDGYYTALTELDNIEPVRQWVFKTNNEGKATLNSTYLVSGDELYKKSNGDITFPLGTLTIQETKAPIGYIIDDTIFIRQITSSDSVAEEVTSYNEPIVKEQVEKGQLIITKVRSDEDEPDVLTAEEGAEYQVYVKSKGSYESCNEAERDILVTDKNGRAESKELPYGTYVLHQIKGTKGYHFTDVEMTINKDGQVVEKLINNPREKVYLKIIKKDSETGNTITAYETVFKLKDDKGNYVSQTVKTADGNISIDTFSTGTDGIAELPAKLNTGTYTICEIQSPYGYLLGSELTFELKYSADVVEVIYEDTPIKGKIIIEKTGDVFVDAEVKDGITYPVYAERLLDGAVFEIYAAEDILVGGQLKAKKGELVDTVTTSANKQAESTLIYPGKYELKEKTAPIDYNRLTETIPVEITIEDNLTPIITSKAEIENEWQKAEISLVKEAEVMEITEDANGIKSSIAVKAGKGFVFGLYAAEDFTCNGGAVAIPKDTLVGKGETDENGKLVFEVKLPHGSYYIKEIYTNQSYKKDDTKYDIDLSYDVSKTVISVQCNDGKAILNELIYYPVTLNKKDILNDTPLAGSTLEVKSKATNEIVYRAVTDVNGALPDIPLVPGEYELTEILCPEYYELNTAVYTFGVDEDGTVSGATTVYDTYNRIEIIKTKTDKETIIAGCTFALYDMNDIELARAISDENGRVIFEKLPFGSYVVREIEAASGFMLSNEELMFVVGARWVNSENIVIYTNDPIPAIQTGFDDDYPVGALVGCIVCGIIAAGCFISAAIIFVKWKKRKGTNNEK